MQIVFTGIISSKAQHHISIVGHRNRILCRRQIILPVQETTSVQVQRMLQVDLLHSRVGRATDTDHTESVAVQMEGM